MVTTDATISPELDRLIDNLPEEDWRRLRLGPPITRRLRLGPEQPDPDACGACGGALLPWNVGGNQTCPRCHPRRRRAGARLHR